MSMKDFWVAFLPNLAATILGVVLGLPAALLVNRRLTEHQRSQEDKTNRQRRDECADVLIDACKYNMRVLAEMRELTLELKAQKNPDLRSTTLDAISPMFFPLCSDPVLLQKLSHHWLRLKRLEAHTHEVFEQAVGLRSRSEDPEVYPAMWAVLRDGSASLHAHADEIVRDLEALKTSNAARSSG